jgi:predicted deacylase
MAEGVAFKRWRREVVRHGRETVEVWWCEVRGARPGPELAVIAGQHGMEPAGPAFLAAWLSDLDPSELRGVVRATPLAYAEALRCGFECAVTPRVLAQARRSGMSRGGACPWRLSRQTCGRNLNRLWPGKRGGSIHERLVEVLWRRVVAGARHVVDFHCWSDAGPAGVIGYDDESLELGRWFGLPHLHRYPMTDHPGLLALYAVRDGRAAITVELTPQLRVTADAAETGRRGLENVMRRLGMLAGAPASLPAQFLVEYGPRDRRRLRMPWDGIVMPRVAAGGFHRAGDLLATAVRIDRPQVTRDFLAPCDGVFLAQTGWSVVAKGGDALTFYTARRLPQLRL